MKKIMAVFLIIIYALSTFSACGGDASAGSTQLPDSEVEEPEEIIGEMIDDSILQISAADIDGDKYQVVDAVIIDEHYLLVSWCDYDYKESGLWAYDLYMGEITWEYELSGGEMYTLNAYPDGSFEAHSYLSEYLYFPKLGDDYPDTISFPEPDFTENEGAAYFEAYTIYAPKKYVHVKESEIYLGEYSKRETLLCDLSDFYEDFIDFCYEHDGKFYFTAFNKFTLESDFLVVYSDGTFKYLYENTRGVPMTSDKKAYSYDNTAGNVNVRYKDSMFYDLEISFDTNNEGLMVVNDDRFATFDYYTAGEGTAVFRVYSTEDGSLLYKTDKFGDYGWLAASDFVDNDTVFLAFSKSRMISDEDYRQDTTFFLVDYSQLEPLERERPIGTDISVPLELEAMLEREYGVEIFTKEEAVIDFPDFYAVELDNVATITETLESLQWVMEKFPYGFFDELYSDEFEYGPTKLQIYITSTLSPANSTGTSYPAAYAYYDYENRAQVIVLDGTQSYSIKTNFAHELMHAIETNINTRTDHITLFGFDEWNEYLPEGFEYNYSYRGDDGFDYNDDEYTAIYGGDPETTYFLDAYSKTFPLEDRARLFEHLFVAESSNETIFINPHIKARAEYLCSVIHEYFETVRNADNIWWERFFD